MGLPRARRKVCARRGERAGIFWPARLEKIEGRADRDSAWGVSDLLVTAASGVGTPCSHFAWRHSGLAGLILWAHLRRWNHG